MYMWLWLLYVLLFLVLLFLAARFYIYGNDDYWAKQGVPFVLGDEVAPFWDRISFKFPLHELDLKMYQLLKSKSKAADSKPKFGGVFEMRRPVAYITDLDLIKNIMVKDFDSFANRRAFGRRDDPTLFGKMLINMENQEWKDMRSAMSPTFTTGKIRRMFAIFTESTNRMVDFIKREAATAAAGAADMGAGADLDLKDAASRLTMDVVASTAFGLESKTFEDKNSIFARMGARFQAQFSGLRVFKLFAVIMVPWIFKVTGMSMMDTEAFQFFSRVTSQTVSHRKASGERREDFLQLLIDARDGQLTETGGGDEAGEEQDETKAIKSSPKAVEWTDDLILAQSLLFFLAGFDTTETLLIYALYELALNPDIQERLATELNEAAASSPTGALTYDIVNQHEYLDMIISETLRKYPPAGRTERKCTADYTVPGTGTILRDQVAVIPIYALHHDPEYYPEPHRFIPERFTPAEVRKRRPYSYMPFGAGPRICIAQRFALIEGKTAIASLVRAFKIEPCSKTSIPIVFATNGTLKPLNGMWLKVTARN